MSRLNPPGRMAGRVTTHRSLQMGVHQSANVISKFQYYVHSLGTSKDTPKFRVKPHQSRRRTGNILRGLSALLEQDGRDHGDDVEAGRCDLISSKQEQTLAVASCVFQINTAVNAFQPWANALRTPKDTPDLQEKLHKTWPYIGNLVKDTSERLEQASETDHQAGVSIADAKLEKDNQAVLKEFQKTQLAAEKETAYAPFVPQTVLSSSYSAGDQDVNEDKSSEQCAVLVKSRRMEALLPENENAPKEILKDGEENEEEVRQVKEKQADATNIRKDEKVSTAQPQACYKKSNLTLLVCFLQIFESCFLWER